MCILFLYANGNPIPGGYKLILSSNRDEFYARPAASADRWPVADETHVLGGIDMEPGREGGTWLGVGGKKGVIRIGALLNITSESKKNPLGRGPIVANYIKGNKNIESYCKDLVNKSTRYNGFNFVSVEITDNDASIYSCTNIPKKCETFPNGCYSFGNSPTTSPLQKVVKGRELFQNILNENIQDKSELVEKCMDLLKTRTKFWPDDELRYRAPNWAEDLSSICVRVPNHDYGSRTHTVILVDSNNKLDFYEETMITENPEGKWKKTHLEEQF